MEITAWQIDELLAILRDQRGIDLSGYRRGTLLRRLADRLEQIQVEDATAYLRLCRENAAERDALLDALAVNYSLFFRDPLVFEMLAARVLPTILQSRRDAGRQEFRAWSAGCAAGEEPYSLAILLAEILRTDLARWAIRIFATDIDGEALARAHAGIYPVESLEQTRLGLVERYFTANAGQYRLHPAVREMVHFSADDLTSAQTQAPPDSIFGEFDLVLCRNVLIYLSPDLQQTVLAKLHHCLATDGYLVLGDAESLNPQAAPRLEVVDAGNCIFRQHRADRAPGDNQ